MSLAFLVTILEQFVFAVRKNCAVKSKFKLFCGTLQKELGHACQLKMYTNIYTSYQFPFGTTDKVTLSNFIIPMKCWKMSVSGHTSQKNFAIPSQQSSFEGGLTR